MRPRPRSRRKPLEYVPCSEVAEEIRLLRAKGFDPPAVLVGNREWRLMRAQPDAPGLVWGICTEELMLDGVPVITRHFWAAPRVMATADEYEQAMLEAERRRL